MIFPATTPTSVATVVSRPSRWRSRISAAPCLAGKSRCCLRTIRTSRIGASKFREWADQNGLNMLLGGSNTGVNIAMSKVAGAKKVPYFAIGPAGASLTNQDCTFYSVHYVYDTVSLANGTASAIVSSGGKT